MRPEQNTRSMAIMAVSVQTRGNEATAMRPWLAVMFLSCLVGGGLG